MLFNSLPFAVFIAIVLACYYCLTWRAQNVLLLVASYVFYGWWDWRFLALLAGYTAGNYVLGAAIARSNSPLRRKGLLTTSVVLSLGVLGFFKYFNFFIDSLNACLLSLGIAAPIGLWNIVLPVGISFFTFQTMSYTIDIYRREMSHIGSFATFALYVSFFPQLVAGPIERAQHLLPQFLQKRSVCLDDLRYGCLLILIGFFRKVGIADSLARVVAPIFANPSDHSSIELLAGMFFFSLQIYCDFAGYSDIARGLGKLLGLDIMQNFRQPYFSTSITEFWRRWHISLSTWLRDYLYIPLGGNRTGHWRTYRNLLLTMVLGGLWHGAQWTFIAWGTLHGLFLAIHKVLSSRRTKDAQAAPRANPIALFASMAGTFGLVSLAWLFFRCATFAHAWDYMSGLLLWRPGHSSDALELTMKVILCGGAILAIDFFQHRADNEVVFLTWPWWLRGSFYAGMLVWILSLGGIDDVAPFIYFQF